MSLASRLRTTISFLRVFAAIGGVGVVLVILGVSSFGGLPLALALGLALIAFALVQLPVALLVGGAADATRAINVAIKERRMIRTREQDFRAGLLSVPAGDGGELSKSE
jgi:hypothetical protein